MEKHNLTPRCVGEHKDWGESVKNKSREESLTARGKAEEDARMSTSVAPAKTLLCIPFNQPEHGTKCVASDNPAKCWVLGLRLNGKCFRAHFRSVLTSGVLIEQSARMMS